MRRKLNASCPFKIGPISAESTPRRVFSMAKPVWSKKFELAVSLGFTSKSQHSLPTCLSPPPSPILSTKRNVTMTKRLPYPFIINQFEMD